MKYYSYSEPTSADDMTPITVTLSEKEILDSYWDYWYSRMVKKFGREVVDQKYSEIDCIEDWCIIHWATRVK